MQFGVIQYTKPRYGFNSLFVHDFFFLEEYMTDIRFQKYLCRPLFAVRQDNSILIGQCHAAVTYDLHKVEASFFFFLQQDRFLSHHLIILCAFLLLKMNVQETLYGVFACSLQAQLHDNIYFPQLSEAATSLPPCPPAETAEINQCDLTDALIDTERTLHEDDREFGKIALSLPYPQCITWGNDHIKLKVVKYKPEL